MDGDVAGVRITPPLVEFVDSAANQLYTANLTVQNVSKFSKRIRFHAPVTDKFKLTVKNPERPVAPGLELFATIEFLSEVAEDARDRVILAVDDDIIEIPLYSYTPTPLLDLEGPVDFGMVVANSRVLSQEVALINHGSMTGEFSMTYDGPQPIVISPMSGKVTPKTIQLVKVELVTETPGEVNETVKVKLEGMQDTELIIKASIVEQSLQLLSGDSKTALKCVSFGPAYYGTDLVQPAILFNNGPEPIKWVSVLEEGADGEEAGTDLTKSTAAMLATSPMQRIRGKAFDVLTSLITVFPNQGVIGPYQKLPVHFRFSPRFNSSNVGWEATEKPPPRQDFALFMRFEMVGSNDSFISDANDSCKKIEIAVTATAIPVLVNIQPSNTFDFGEVMSGDHTSALCTLTNESALLPINIQCRKVAHFNVCPVQSKIAAGKSQDIMISFQPNQAGTFNPLQLIDVLGKAVNTSEENENENGQHQFITRPFQTIPIQLIGTSVAVSKIKGPKINPGITPLITNETGQFVDVTFNDLNKINKQLRPSVVNAGNSILHSQGKKDGSAKKVRVAFPNDRAQSIRPSKRDEEYQTPFTRSTRHTYVDPDYAYTIEEEEDRKAHKDKYAQFIRECSEKRMHKEQAREFKQISNKTDLALRPAAGLKPPNLSAKGIESPAPYQVSPLHERHRLLTTRQLANQERQATTRPVTEGLNAVPMTHVEKMDCKIKLTPQDLHKVIIGPPTIDFGEVCLRSTNNKHLHIVNNLSHFIHVQVTIDCKELRQTSPLSQVIPAQSKAQFTLVFESSSDGKFQRSISYSVNTQHESHVLVLANVIPVALKLSSTYLELTSQSTLPADAGYRTIVTLFNKRNYPADFTWSPILTDRGTAFSIRPATGTVDAYKDLKCEVVFHPSYFAPLEGEFHMQVHNGNSMKLKCLAKLGAANVQFVERRILFGNVPLNMRTTRTALLHNSGHSHAMFYVINSNPFPGMTVSPVHGVVPVGGNAELKITLAPTAVVKFDTWIQVNIRGWKTIDLRMGGTVQPPEVDIDVKAFKFNGVYCNSKVTIPFTLINMTTTRVRADFDLTRYSDFNLSFPEEEIDDDPTEQQSLPENMYSVELSGQQKLNCVLTFRPTSVAQYDFNLPVVINKTGAPSPTPSTFPPTPVPSERHIITPRPIVITIPTPRRRVIATALRPIMEISSTRLSFSLPVTYMEMSVADNAVGDQQKLLLTNKSSSTVEWKLDLESVTGMIGDSAFAFIKPGGAWFTLENISGSLKAGESYNLTIIFCPRKVGSYVYSIPFILNNDFTKPYRHITLSALLQAPNISFDPLALVLTPVPLSTAVYAEFNIIATGYIKENELKVDVPDVEADDGSMISCFALEFPNGPTIPTPKNMSTSHDEKVSAVIPCILTFNSDKPVSSTIDVTLTDRAERKFSIPVTATADNCLLTVYPFLAAHRNDHQIVCEQDKTLRGPGALDANSTSLGEAVLLPCVSPHRPSTRGSTSATSSHFGTASSSFGESTNSVTGDTTSYYMSTRLTDIGMQSSAIYTSTTCATRYTSIPDSITFKSDSEEDSEFGPHSSRDGAHPAHMTHSDTTGTSQHKTNHQINKNATHDVASLHKGVDQGNLEEANAQRELVSRSLGSAVFPFECSLEAHFHLEVLNAAQRWFSSHGWPGGPFPITVPHGLRRLVTRMPNDEDASVNKKSPNGKRGNGTTGGWDTNLKKDVKTIYDMLQHLCGRMVPGIPINQPLPQEPTERVLQLYWQHSTLLTFLRGQGASVSAIRPEFLLTPRDYRRWVKVREREAKQATSGSGRDSVEQKDNKNEKSTASMIHIEDELFESVSKRAWTDLLLQLFKVLVLSRVTPAHYKNLKPVDKTRPLPTINSDPLASNVYSTGERIVLAWLNHHYENQRLEVWGERSMLKGEKGGVPPSRWVVNFDYDLLDGLVLAAAVSAYCPWLKADYFSEMYTAPSTPEQCLHNTLILVRAIRSSGIDYDIQATDITDPNPISLLLLCVYLYQNLPQYSPKSSIEFVGSLHSVVRRQVRLNNPSSRSLKYQATISGRDASDFTLPDGEDVYVPPRGEMNLEVNFTSRLIRPAEAVLVLVGRREAATVGSTLVFDMKTAVDDIHPTASIQGEAPCYEFKKINVSIISPFKDSGKFRIVLVESNDGPPSPLDIGKNQGIVRSNKKTLSSRIRSVKSRTDHGQPKELSPPPSPLPAIRLVPDNPKANKSTMTSQLTAFFCHESHMFLRAGEATDLKVGFLPFSVGKKFCSILLINETIGEFLYSVEANSLLPIPSSVPFNSASQHSVRISSAAAAERGRGLFGGDDRIIYWKCENNATLQENLNIPITNEAKEKALRIAARQRMSKKEQERRTLTGTLDSGSVTAAVAAMGLVDNEQFNDPQDSYSMHPTSAPPRPRGSHFTVEASSEWFEVPKTILIPSPLTYGPPPASEMKLAHAGPNDRQNDGHVPLQVTFTPQGPGHYPCDIILRSQGDVRVYRIECTVNPAGTTASFDFHTPAHQSITQSIPIQNASNHDWELQCSIEGKGFHGPFYMTAKAGQTTYYPLMFKPHYECNITGKLSIKNKSDGTEHLFNLRGIGESPLALDHIEVECRCHSTVERTVTVPNYVPDKLTYRVFSDIPYLEGPNMITVPKGKAVDYTFNISTWKRGMTKGVLAFVVDEVDKGQSLNRDDSDSDDNIENRPITQESKTPSYLKPVRERDGSSGYRVWYSVDIISEPPDAIGVLPITCPVQRSIDFEIPLKNPSGETVVYEVKCTGDTVTGPTSITLAPHVPAVYTLNYSPCVVGKTEGTVVFYSELTGEFWYKLSLECASPPPTTLPTMDCQLGRWTRQYISICNPTDEPMEVEAYVSNKTNFSIDMSTSSGTSIHHDDQDRLFQAFCVHPRSTLDIPIMFMATSLGAHTHQTTVTLKSKQLGEATYLISGRGLSPSTMEPLSVSAAMRSSTSIILPFRNPTDVNVLADIVLSDNEQTMNNISSSVLRKSITVDSSFCLLLKHSNSVLMEPKQNIDIPFTFAPDTMRRKEGMLSISLRREDGKPWSDENDGIEDLSGLKGRYTESEPRPLSRSSDGSIKAIRWIYPVHGIPEVRSKETKDAVLHCQARSRIEERLEVTLTGAVPSSSSGCDLVKLRAVTPLKSRRGSANNDNNEGVVVEGHSVAEEFSFKVECPDSAEARQQLEQALAVSLVRKERDPHTGLVVLLFNLVFSPFRPLCYKVVLTVTSAMGGLWSFPLTVQASEPPPDDVITVEAAGLGKGSAVSFVLFSHSRHATPFNAFFVSGSDSEFTVTPESGELQPQGTNGTRLAVVFTPNMYGKSYNARLIIQTLDMQWAYDVKGVTPEYRVPNVPSTLLSSLARPRAVNQRQRVNYVRQNMKLTATAVSSPIKGASLLQHITGQ